MRRPPALPTRSETRAAASPSAIPLAEGRGTRLVALAGAREAALRACASPRPHAGAAGCGTCTARCRSPAAPWTEFSTFRAA